MQKSDSINELAKALVKVQRALKPAVKESDNPFFKSKYADLTAVWEACYLPLADNGLALVQVGEPTIEGDKVHLTSMLIHESGQWIAGTFSAPYVKQDAQAVGSCITYLRRYSLAAMVGVRTEDDDGAAASGTVVSFEKGKGTPSGGSSAPSTDKGTSATDRYGRRV